MDLTTVTRVLDYIKAGDSGLNTSGLTAIINSLIKDVSAQFESYLNRKTEKTSRTEVFDVTSGKILYRLRAFPIDNITTVKNDWDRGFTGTSSLVSASNYTFNAEQGHLLIDRHGLTVGRQVLQIAYTGGMATNTTGFINSFQDIALACDQQVRFEYQRRNTLGQSGVSAGSGGNISWQESGALLKTVRGKLARHRRIAQAR